MFMIISNIAFKSFSIICKSYLSNIVYAFLNILTYLIGATDNQLDSFERLRFAVNCHEQLLFT